MYEYKFVQIKFKRISGKPTEDYREVIKNHGKEGWRLVQFSGMDKYYELIFERPQHP